MEEGSRERVECAIRERVVCVSGERVEWEESGECNWSVWIGRECKFVERV